MDDSPVQTALCVIGHPIAGNPAQFCISRILQSLEMDWQCLSFDVPPESLQAAIAGIDVLHFAGALIAPPHQVAVAKMIRDQHPTAPLPSSALPCPAPNPHLAASSAAPAETIIPPATQSGTGSTPGSSPEKSAKEPSEASSDRLSMMSPWCDALARNPAGKWELCNFIGESLLEMIRQHEQSTGQTLATCVFLGDQTAFESLMVPFIDCLPANTLVLGGSALAPWPPIPKPIPPSDLPPEPPSDLSERNPSQPTSTTDDAVVKTDADDANESPNPLHCPLLLIRPQVAPLSVKKATAKTANNQAVVESLLEDLHPQSLTVHLAPSGAPWPVLRGQGNSANARITPLDLEVGRIAAALQRWTGKSVDRNALTEAIEEYLEV